MTPFSIILDGTVGAVAATRRHIACSVGARILLLDPASLSRLGEIELPPQANVLRLAAIGDRLFALLRDGAVVRRRIGLGEHWTPVSCEAALDLAVVDERIFLLHRTRIIELDARSPGATWKVPVSADRMRGAGHYLVAFGPKTLWIAQLDVAGAIQTFETMPSPVAVAARNDTLLVADHLAGLCRLRPADGFVVKGPVPNLLHPRAVAFDGEHWLAVVEDGLAGSGPTPEVGPDTVLDLVTTDDGLLVVQSRRVSIVRNGVVTAVAEFPGYAFQTECHGESIISATEGGLFLVSREAVARLPLPDPPVAVALAASWLLAASSRGLYAVDLSRPNRPEVRRTFSRCGAPVTLAADPVHPRAVWGCGRALSTLDLCSPAGPTVIATGILGVYPRALALGGSHIYAASGPGGLLVGDTPTGLAPVSDTGYAMDVAADGERASVAAIKSLVVHAEGGTAHFLTDRHDVRACDVLRDRMLVVAGDEMLSGRVSASVFEVDSTTRLPFAPRRVRARADGVLVTGAGGVILVRGS
jgi:hypothetical protein